MNREIFVRLSGWGLIGGAVLFAAGVVVGSLDRGYANSIRGGDTLSEISEIVGIVLGQVLLVVGLLGLRLGYGSRSGGLGAAMLGLSLLGSVVSLGGVLAMGAAEIAWLAWLLGYLIMGGALAVYGLVAIRRRVFSRWNFAPLLAGAIVPVMFGIGVGLEDGDALRGDWVFSVGVVASAIGLSLLGYRIQAEVAGPVSQQRRRPA